MSPSRTSPVPFQCSFIARLIVLSLILLSLLFICAQSFAQESTTQIRWIGESTSYCQPKEHYPLPGQPQLGLIAFNVKCADGNVKVLSAQVTQIVQGYTLNTSKNKGESIGAQELTATPLTISHPSQMPATLDFIENKQLRRPLTAGSLIYPKDLLPQIAWKRNEQVSVVYANARMYVKAAGISLTDGAINQRSKVKIGNKIVTGIARKDKDGGFFLEAE